MQLQKILIPIGAVLLVALAYNAYSWTGVAMVASGMVMWVLLHFTRMMKVMTNAANRPKGYVGSAVMLNAKLKQGATLLHVVAMTKSLGEPLSEPNQQPELFRWTDGGLSHVTCEFAGGKLVKWALVRPESAPDSAADSAPDETPDATSDVPAHGAGPALPLAPVATEASTQPTANPATAVAP